MRSCSRGVLMVTTIRVPFSTTQKSPLARTVAVLPSWTFTASRYQMGYIKALIRHFHGRTVSGELPFLQLDL
jgi:hypothetical protein